MKWMLVAVILMSVPACRDSSQCESVQDCFADEICTDGVCNAPPVTVGGVPAPTSRVGGFQDGRDFDLVLDDEDDPHVFVLSEPGVLEHWWWDGFGWVGDRLADDLNLGEIPDVVGTHDVDAGFVVLVRLDESLLSFESPDGAEFSRHELVQGATFAPAVDGGAGIVAVCAFRGTLADIDSLTPFAMIRGRQGTWRSHEFEGSATPYCGVAISELGVLTLAFSRYDEDFGERLHFAQTIASVGEAVDLTLTPTSRLGRVPSERSLDVVDGTPVLLHVERGVSSADLLLSELLAVDRQATRLVRSIPVDRFVSYANIFLDRLDERRAFVAAVDFTLGGSDPDGVVGEIVGDRIELQPLDEFLAIDANVVYAMGSDGVMRLSWFTDEDGLQYQVGM